MVSKRLAVGVLAGAVAAGAAQPSHEITAARFLSHVQQLASDDMDGRGNGTAALERAADYITSQFRAAGLAPAGEGASFDQVFETEVRIEPPSTSAITVRASGGVRTLSLGRDFYPVSVLDRPAAAGPVEVREAPLVFAGYGIAAPGLGYDDFAGVDVRGAAVLVLSHEPQEHDARSVFDGRHLTPGAAVAAKAREARERGAAMLLVVEDPSHAEDRAMRGAWWADPVSEDMTIPVVRAGRDAISRTVPALDLEGLASRMDRTLSPTTHALAGVTVSYVEHRARFTARLRNIVGVLRGSDPDGRREAVVVGAHYDHVGRGGQDSEAPSATGEIHNGADDNASGTAALIEMARVAGRTRPRFRRSVVFAAFAGEELGLRGSKRYVEQPPVEMARTRAMLNLDMVGRAQGRVMVGTFGRRERLAPALRRLPAWTRLAVVDFGTGGYDEDQSDVASFARLGVPAVAFFTGFHADYHRPSDDWPRIDAEGGAEIARLALKLVEDLAR